MSTGPAANQLWVYFVMDRTGEMGAYIDVYKKQFEDLGETFERQGAATRVIPKFITMGAVTDQMEGWPTPSRVQVSDEPQDRDLAEAFDQVVGSLRAEGLTDWSQVEVFVLLNSEPTGDWERRFVALQQAGVLITLVNIGSKAHVQRETLQRLQIGRQQIMTGGVASRAYARMIFHRIVNAISNRLGPSTRPPRAAARPQPPRRVQPPQPVVGEWQRQPAVEDQQPQQMAPAQPPQPVEDAVPQPQAGVQQSHPPAQSEEPRPVMQARQAPPPTQAGEPEPVEQVHQPDPRTIPLQRAPDEPAVAPAAREEDHVLSTPDEAGIVRPMEPRDEQVPRPRPPDVEPAEGPARDEIEPREAAVEPPGVAVAVEDIVDDQPLPVEVAPEPSEEPVSDQRVEEVEPEVEPAVKAAPPPVGEGGVATIWKEIEPDLELGDRVPHMVTDAMAGLGDWRMIGSSRRGKMHAHKGIFREDAFALGVAEGWHLMVVADGGGSCSLSRVGSQLAATTAVKSMAEFVQHMGGGTLPAEEVCRVALERGLKDAWQALEAEAQKREIPFRELGTTFLSLMHRPGKDEHIVGVVQVGDGLVALEAVNGKIMTLAEPDVGETAGVTLFLTSGPWKQWLDRVWVGRLEEPPRLITAMCDGVADDFIPFNPHLRTLFDGLARVVEREQPEEALLELLAYEKRGSFDDRTLALLYLPQDEQTRGAEVESQPEADAPAGAITTGGSGDGNDV